MAVSIKKIKKDLQEIIEVDMLKKQISELEKENEKITEELRELRKEVASISKRMSVMGPGGRRIKTTPLIDVIEEIMQTKEQPVKVVDLRDELLKDKRVRSKAENFYAVIATAMNNSSKFKKVSSGVYRYVDSPSNN